MTNSLNSVRSESSASNAAGLGASNSETVLSYIEELVNWLCAKILDLYNYFFATGGEVSQSASAGNVPEKVVHFADGSPLDDRTAAKIVKIVPKQVFNLLTQETRTLYDEIFIGDTKVLFSNDLNKNLIFSKKAHTAQVSVEDGNAEGIYTITEIQTVGRPQNRWIVDTNKKFKLTTMGGQLALGEEKAYLSEDQVPADYRALPPQSVIGIPTQGPLPIFLIKV